MIVGKGHHVKAVFRGNLEGADIGIVVRAAVELIAPNTVAIDNGFKVEKAGVTFFDVIANRTKALVLGGDQSLDQHISRGCKLHFWQFHTFPHFVLIDPPPRYKHLHPGGFFVGLNLNYLKVNRA